MKTLLCVNCTYWRQVGSGVGQCRRRAPLPFTNADGIHDRTVERHRANWPETGAKDFCGEFMLSASLEDRATVPAERDNLFGGNRAGARYRRTAETGK